MSSEFDEAIARIATVIQDVSYLITERDQERRKGGVPTELMGKIRGGFNNLERQLDRLDKEHRELETAPSASSLSQREMARRRDEIRKLQNEKTRLRQLDKAAVSSSDRDSLLVAGDGRTYGRETDNTRDFTTQQLVDRSATEMKQQDVILEQMSRGLDSLKNIGVAIQDENSLHMKLLDHLEDEVDRGDAALKRETKRTEIVTRDTKTCWLYSVICVLLLVLIALVAFRYG